MNSDLITQIISRERCAEYVHGIISGEFSGGLEFEPGKILEILLFTYKINCSYENLMKILAKLVASEKLTCLVSGRKYKTKSAT